MKTDQVLRFTLLSIFIVGILGTGSLVYDEIKFGPICPKLIGIPACYIILFCFVIPLINHKLSLNASYYFIGTGIAFSIALYGSIMQLMNLVECPKTSSGIPMCFISLLFFFSLIVLKAILVKTKN